MITRDIRIMKDGVQVDFIVLRLLSENDFDKEIKAHIKSKFGTLTGYTWETNWDSNS